MSAWPPVMTWSTITPVISGMISAIVSLTMNSSTAPEHSWQVGFAVRQDPTEVAGLLVAVRIDIHGMGTLTPVVGRQSARRRRRWTDTSAQNPVAWLRHRLVRRSPADSWIVFAWFSVSVLWCGHSAAATIHVRRVSSSPVTGSSPGRTPCSDSQTRFILEQPPPTATYVPHPRVAASSQHFSGCSDPCGCIGFFVTAGACQVHMAHQRRHRAPQGPLRCGPNGFWGHTVFVRSRSSADMALEPMEAENTVDFGEVRPPAAPRPRPPGWMSS